MIAFWQPFLTTPTLARKLVVRLFQGRSFQFIRRVQECKGP